MKNMVIAGLLTVIVLSLSACGNAMESETYESASEANAYTQEEKTNKTTEIEQEDNMWVANENTSNVGEDSEKILIAYFSLVDIVPEGADASTHATPKIGNTESAALEIQSQVGGDLFAIKTVRTYPVSHQECSAIAEEEMRSDARPELSTHVENMDDYNIIYIGYPIWWYQEPMAIRTFLEEYDLSGKTIIPFCTTLGAGVEESENNIKSLCPDSEVREGLTLYTGRNNFSESVAKWLEKLGNEK